MFTGIIETTGTLRACDTHGDDSTLTIASQAFDFARCALGDSIAVNGVCLTATALGADWFSADVSAETLRLTTLGDRRQPRTRPDTRHPAGRPPRQRPCGRCRRTH